ncbi:tRNA lysidine(34) synthetase TilS [Deinococcus sp. KNUC1210]|uniref:tRNA lysidine(34) synthetase TilS n=1 Tax=Deinococcus sp. KNUC1210 TaxID=2917691 RepID=UPI001EF03E15|nr:tRNA lysidine(34) synthetase TilS [Deinococcus sp. KNUC1210]ULH16257.1 tRNA lysidine(34) synthetase TilS [Deinococcus sp. KNUC1210]
MNDVLPAALRSPLLPYRGRRVLVAVSGGADSVALLRALHAVGADVSAAHFDHGMRPSSAQDADFVRGLAASLNVPFATERADVGRIAAQKGWNLEDAARRLRYSFLTRAAKAAGVSGILTAHTRRDVAETVLWQLLRGEAVLNGIPAQRGQVERPWLTVSRAEIESYLGRLEQPWREDASNADTRFTRNWLRAEVLPLLAARSEGLEAALLRLARFQAQDDAALNAQAQAISEHAPLGGLPLAVLRRYARQRLQPPLHAGHLEEIAAALSGGHTRHLTLPGERPLTISAGRLVLEALPTPRPGFELPDGWELRHRLPGDQIHLPGGTRRLSDVLTDLHVPRLDRDRVWLLARERAVQWVGLTPALWAVGAQAAAGQARQPGDPETDESAMQAALALARQAAELGEVPVGAVVLWEGRIIAEAFNRSREQGDMTRHAELDALRQAASVLADQGGYLSGCTLVVTLEPCPMCLGAALEARIGRIVYGAANPRAGALGGVSDLLGHAWGHRPLITGGLLASASARLLRQTFRQIRAASPAADQRRAP